MTTEEENYFKGKAPVFPEGVKLQDEWRGKHRAHRYTYKGIPFITTLSMVATCKRTINKHKRTYTKKLTPNDRNLYIRTLFKYHSRDLGFARNFKSEEEEIAELKKINDRTIACIDFAHTEYELNNISKSCFVKSTSNTIQSLNKDVVEYLNKLYMNTEYNGVREYVESGEYRDTNRIILNFMKPIQLYR